MESQQPQNLQFWLRNCFKFPCPKKLIQGFFANHPDVHSVGVNKVKVAAAAVGVSYM